MADKTQKKYVPLGKRVLIRPDAKKTESDGGIILPGDGTTQEQNYQWGTVEGFPENVAAVSEELTGIDIGTRVAYSAYTAMVVGDRKAPLHVVPINELVVRE